MGTVEEMEGILEDLRREPTLKEAAIGTLFLFGPCLIALCIHIATLIN